MTLWRGEESKFFLSFSSSFFPLTFIEQSRGWVSVRVLNLRVVGGYRLCGSVALWVLITGAGCVFYSGLQRIWGCWVQGLRCGSGSGSLVLTRASAAASADAHQLYTDTYRHAYVHTYVCIRTRTDPLCSDHAGFLRTFPRTRSACRHGPLLSSALLCPPLSSFSPTFRVLSVR